MPFPLVALPLAARLFLKFDRSSDWLTEGREKKPRRGKRGDMWDILSKSLDSSARGLEEETHVMRQWNVDLDNRLEVTIRSNMENSRLAASLGKI